MRNKGDMKRVNILDTMHTSIANSSMKDFGTNLEQLGIYFEFKLADLMEERGLSVRDLAKLSGLRLATISDLMQGNKGSINLHHIVVLMMVLKVTNITDIINVHIPKELQIEMKLQSQNWIESRNVPSEVMVLSSLLVK